MFDKIALIGIGLIGSSIALGAKKHSLAKHIAISTRSEKTLAQAKQLGLGDSYFVDAKKAVEGADLIILCTPVGSFENIIKNIAPNIKAGAILSDVGSVKEHVQKVIAPILPLGVHFVPAHPMAGTEYSGPKAGFLSLFEGRWCMLTPSKDQDKNAIKSLLKFWQGLGSQVEIMDAKHHDLVVAITSHVPHLIAYNIVGTASELENVSKSEVIKYSAGGFRDFTRIAASDPVMWRDVFLTNKDAVLEMLGRFLGDLDELKMAVQNGDGQALEELFTRTRAIRRSIIEAGQETSDADFGRHI
jgi:cyclohexadieny/prephenate dehydrogenase